MTLLFVWIHFVVLQPKLMYNALSADKTIRVDFMQMARDIRTISKKLKSRLTSGEEGIDFLCLCRLFGTLKLRKRHYISRSEIR